MSLKFSHKPRKRFGQNFLKDPRSIHNIITAIAPQTTDRVVEIGPGLGALTKPLLEHTQHLDVIEIDRDLAQQLKTRFQHSSLTIYTEDALYFDFNKFATENPNIKKFRIVGNLPYNISTPLMFHLLKFSSLIEDIHFMLQKEVADRLAATPNQKNYGRLSVMTQYACAIQTLFTVESNAFYPVPKVQSAFVRLKPYPAPPFVASNVKLLQEITKAAFNQRRKTIANALKLFLKPSDFSALVIDPSARPDSLSVANFVHISNFIDHHLTHIP